MVDASAIIEYILRTPYADVCRQTIEAQDVELHVPALCDVEVTAVVRRALLAARLMEDRARFALMDYMDLPITRHGHQALLPRILTLYHDFSAYDATYVALAERLGADLLTGDRALANAAKKHAGVNVLQGW